MWVYRKTSFWQQSSRSDLQRARTGRKMPTSQEIGHIGQYEFRRYSAIEIAQNIC